MATATIWKIYDPEGGMIAQAVTANLAAGIVDYWRTYGVTVRVDGRVVWREGSRKNYGGRLVVGGAYADAAMAMEKRRAEHTTDRLLTQHRAGQHGPTRAGSALAAVRERCPACQGPA